MRKHILWAVLALTISVPAQAGDRAGFFPWPVGSAGVTVAISPPMTNAQYTAVVQPTNTAGFSSDPNNGCVYFNVLNLTPTQFQVQLKNCHTGATVNTATTITLAWIVVTHPE